MFCKECGRKYKTQFHAYSSGNGCLSLNWVWVTKNNHVTADRPVTRADVIHYLNGKDAGHLKADGWVPVIVQSRWVLARYIKRTGPNRLWIADKDKPHTIYYSVDQSRFDGNAEEANLTTTFKMRVKGKMETFDMRNLSLRMTIRFFLNHEQELKKQFRDIYPLD